MFVRIRCAPGRAHIAEKAKKNSVPYCMYWYIISRPTTLKFSSRSGHGPIRYTSACVTIDARCDASPSGRCTGASIQ